MTITRHNYTQNCLARVTVSQVGEPNETKGQAASLCGKEEVTRDG